MGFGCQCFRIKISMNPLYRPYPSLSPINISKRGGLSMLCLGDHPRGVYQYHCGTRHPNTAKNRIYIRMTEVKIDR